MFFIGRRILMKKIVVFLMFIMPIIFTNQFETKEVLSSDIESKKFDYGDYTT